MCAQHYVEVPYCTSIIYPEQVQGCTAGVLLDRTPTPYPDHRDQYFDSYRFGHVRAHLVEDMAGGVLTANAGYNLIMVGGRCVCGADREDLIAYAQTSGFIICDAGRSGVRCIFIGGQYNMWSIQALCWHISFDYGNMTYRYSDVKKLFLGDASDSPYWWFAPDSDLSYKRQYRAWCESFDSIWHDVMADGDAIDKYRYPYDVFNGKNGKLTPYYSGRYSVFTCTVNEPRYEFVPFGAENDWLELALSFGQPDGRRVRRYLADSYVSAASQLPQAAANTLQNMLELGSLISNLVHGNFSSLKDFANLKNLWLAYRYSYTTTKLDISDYRNVTNRLLALSDVPNVTTHGISVFDNYRVRTSIEVAADEVIPHDAKTFMSAFNAKLSMVNTWDMIPWSFVVDWFFHVGDVLERLEECASAYNLNPVSCWSSIERLGGKFYLRFPYAYSGGASVFQDFSCSNKTFIMRIADAICLFSR